MSFFKDFKKSALSRSYQQFFSGGGVIREQDISEQVSEATRAGVQEKVEAAVAKAQLQPSLPSINSDLPPGDNASHHDPPITASASQQSLDVDPVSGQSAYQGKGDDELGASTPSTKTEVDVKQLSEALIDPNELWDRFFSILIEGAVRAVADNVDEKKARLEHSIEVRKAVERGKNRFTEVLDFPVKLILTPLKRGHKAASVFASMLDLQFGPLHAALQVGEIVLEWDDSSLVTPYLCAYEDKIMEIDMQPYGKWVKYTEEHYSTMRESAMKLNYPDQIEFIYAATAMKKRLIDALIDVVVTYNKFYYYNLFSRNCQHFVRDALEALQIEVPKELPGGLGEYYKALVAGKTPSLQAEFKTHSSLNTYVMDKQRDGTLADIPQHDLEYLLTLCFRFHLESKTSLRKDPKALEEWQCQEKNCCMPTLDSLIKTESMKLHSFAI